MKHFWTQIKSAGLIYSLTHLLSMHVLYDHGCAKWGQILKPGLRSRRILSDSDSSSDSDLKIPTPTPTSTPLRLRPIKSYFHPKKSNMMWPLSWFPFRLHSSGWCGKTSPVRANCRWNRHRYRWFLGMWKGMIVFEFVDTFTQWSRWP